MQDWEKRLSTALGTFQAGDEEYNLTPLLALASEAGRQATYWQAKSQEMEVRMQELKVVLGWGEGRKDEDQQARIADLQARIRQQEGHIEDLNALVDRLLEVLPRIMDALAIMRNPHDGPGEGKESPVPGDRKDPQGVRQDKISDALAP
jgi:uncharacterized coiled-coil protein SlyX